MLNATAQRFELPVDPFFYAFRSPSARDLKSRFVHDAESWPRLFFKMIPCRQRLGTAASPVFRRAIIGLSKTTFIIVDPENMKEVMVCRDMSERWHCLT